MTSGRRLSNGAKLHRMTARRPPRDLYVGTASWLDPVDLPRIRDKRRPAPILLDHLVVFDIDMRPFSVSRIERARKATVCLLDWLRGNTELELVHATFTGGKGFHLVLRDPDRSAFATPDPRQRERVVREQRLALLNRVIDDGHPVDSTVTADTRRIIRVPGSVHGTTGWICTIVSEERLRTPFHTWMGDLPRHPLAIEPSWFAYPPRRWLSEARRAIRSARIRWRRRRQSRGKAGREAKRAIEAADEGAEARAVHGDRRLPEVHGIGLQASSHVVGTKDRSALMWWLPMDWGDARETVSKAEEMLDALDLGPAAFWVAEDDRILMIVPRAIPKRMLARRMRPAGLGRLSYELDAQGHAWVDVSPRVWNDDSLDLILSSITHAAHDQGLRCTLPWSRPHLELCSRLGIPIRPPDDAELSGKTDPALRFVVVH